MKKLCILLLALLLCCAAPAGAERAGTDAKTGRHAKQPYAALLAVYGEIDIEDAEYDHFGTLDALAALEEDEENVGLILLLDTPGGSVYEMDELYHAIMSYRGSTREGPYSPTWSANAARRACTWRWPRSASPPRA